MISAEDRARTAMRAIAATVDDAPPLRLAPAPGARAPRLSRQRQQGRRWRIRIAPVMAAVAMLAVGLSLAIVRVAPNGPAVPASTIPASADRVPRYYVALDVPSVDATAIPGRVVVGDTLSGKQLLTVALPGGGWVVHVTGAADDRTFVVAATASTSVPGSDATAFYLIRVAPGPQPSATVHKLPVHVPADNYTGAIALSSDGTELAMGASEDTPSGRSLDYVLRIYSVTTGQVLRAWTKPLTAPDPVNPIDGLWWTGDGRQLAFSYNTGNASTEIRLLLLTRPGNNLLADSRSVWSTHILDLSTSVHRRPLSCAADDPSMLVTGDGTTIVCAASGISRDLGKLPAGICPAVPPWNNQGVFEYSTATSKLSRVVYTQDTNCSPYFVPGTLLWASGTGDTVIGYFTFAASVAPNAKKIVKFGVFTEHRFTPLPLPPAAIYSCIAW